MMAIASDDLFALDDSGHVAAVGHFPDLRIALNAEYGATSERQLKETIR